MCMRRPWPDPNRTGRVEPEAIRIDNKSSIPVTQMVDNVFIERVTDAQQLNGGHQRQASFKKKKNNKSDRCHSS